MCYVATEKTKICKPGWGRGGYIGILGYSVMSIDEERGGGL